MKTAAFQGKLVRLTAYDPEKDAQIFQRWNQDSEYQQLLDSGPARLLSDKQIKELIEKHYDEQYSFTIRTLEDDRIIGEVGLAGINWVSGDSWVGIGIGERDCWGKGCGTEAMRLLLQFAFAHLNLKRVSLTVFEYNTRAIRSYEKAGFREEGRLRQWMQRAGERYDLIYMGILREEWEETQEYNLIMQRTT